jgi:hypothetical protein
MGPNEALVMVGMMRWTVPLCWECGERMSIDRLSGDVLRRERGDGLVQFCCYRIVSHERLAGDEVVHQARFMRTIDGDSVELSTVRASDWALLFIGSMP